MRYHHPVANYKHLSFPSGDVSQWFGENSNLYSRWGLAGHNGIDIVRPHGTALHAVEDGIVLDVRNDPEGFGKHVRFISKEQNDDSTYNEWTYGHNHKNLVSVGDEITGGQTIALMGNTGFVVSGDTPFWEHNPFAGTHLHIGVRKVKRVKRGGWTYPESDIRLQTQNHSNGYRGAVDPWRYLQQSGGNQKSYIRSIQNATIGLLNRLIDRYNDKTS